MLIVFLVCLQDLAEAQKKIDEQVSTGAFQSQDRDKALEVGRGPLGLSLKPCCE